jgi:hypothetical protein
MEKDLRVPAGHGSTALQRNTKDGMSPFMITPYTFCATQLSTRPLISALLQSHVQVLPVIASCLDLIPGPPDPFTSWNVHPNKSSTIYKYKCRRSDQHFS